jgi:hypothetical protein
MLCLPVWNVGEGLHGEFTDDPPDVICLYLSRIAHIITPNRIYNNIGQYAVQI